MAGAATSAGFYNIYFVSRGKTEDKPLHTKPAPLVLEMKNEA